MITIKNLRNEKCTQPWDVRVDRQSVLGNPFYMKYESQRDKVCDEYEKWLHNKLFIRNIDKSIIHEMNRLWQIYKKYGKLNLFCWCAPKRCHAETIKVTLEKVIGSANE